MNRKLQQRLVAVVIGLQISLIILSLCTSESYAQTLPYGAPYSSLEGLRQEQQAKLTILKKSLKSPHAKTRLKAIDELYKLPYGEEAATELVELIEDENVDVRRRATCVLSSLGQAEGASALANALGDQDNLVRECAATSLYGLKNPTPEIVTALIEALRDEDVGVRANAASTLGTFGKAAEIAIPALKALKSKGGYATSLVEEALRRIQGQNDAQKQSKERSSFELQSNSSNHITGKDTGLKASIDASADDADGNHVSINFYLDRYKQISAEVYRSEKFISVKSFSSKTNEVIALDSQDIYVFKSLLESVAPLLDSRQPISDTLVSLLNYLGSASPGYILNYVNYSQELPLGKVGENVRAKMQPSSGPEDQYRITPTALTSICGKNGQNLSTNFTITVPNSSDAAVTVTRQVGQCFTGEALG